MKCSDISKIVYHCPPVRKATGDMKPLKTIGLDTEAYTDGKCFMIALSTGQIYRPSQLPKALFTRENRNSTYVCYNLKYDMGALLQGLPLISLEVLRKGLKLVHNGFEYWSIANKYLRIKRGKNCIHVYDILSFFKMSLSRASQIYLNDDKLPGDVEKYTPEYVQSNWDDIARYCVHDAGLTQRLATTLIDKFLTMGLRVTKLYSAAYIANQFFQSTTPAPTVKRYWQDYKPLLDLALKSYAGGKFEVTVKGPGYYYEYDLKSAYAHEIGNLIDVTYGRVVHDKVYHKGAVYGYITCNMSIPYNIYTPVATKHHGVNCYMVGEYQATITKTEYEYLISVGCDITIIDAWWIHVDNKQYPYRQAIDKLMRWKDKYNTPETIMEYNNVKLLMNSYYGKMVQLIPKDDIFVAGRSWHPIYSSVITANTRIKVSKAQQQHDSVIAVHTDSIISTKPLDYPKTGKLGDMIYEIEGDGVVLGSGVYQIGDKVRFRGLERGITIVDTLKRNRARLQISEKHCKTWREVAWQQDDIGEINHFIDRKRNINVRFDQKRLWLDDWKSWKEPLHRNVESSPLPYDPVFLGGAGEGLPPVSLEVSSITLSSLSNKLIDTPISLCQH